MIRNGADETEIEGAGAGLLRFAPDEDSTLGDRFASRAAGSADRPFLIWEGEPIRYGEANARANRMAAYMRSQGFGCDDVVAIMVENSPEFLWLWIALSKLGAVAALINTQARGEGLVHALCVSESKALFVGEECLDKLATTGEALVDLSTFVVPRPGEKSTVPPRARIVPSDLGAYSPENPEPPEREGPAGESLLALIFTSGTTGLPKACRLSNMRWMGAGDSVSRVLGLSRDEIFYGVLPLFHSAGGGSLLSTTLATGGSLVLRRKFSASRFWDEAREHRVSFVQYVGELCRYLLNQPSNPLDSKHEIRHMVGSGLNAKTFSRFRERFGVERIIESYGGTDLNIGLVNLDNKPGACGHLPPGSEGPARLVRYDVDRECHLRDTNGYLIDCADDEPGELIAKIMAIPGVPTGRFEGYTDSSASEAKILRNAFTPGDAYLRSGDVLKRDAEGYYYFVDRLGDTFRWKGENVSTAEVATALSSYPGMELLTICGVRVPDHEGRAGMAVVVMQDGQVFDPAAFFALAESELPPYSIPVFVRVAARADITATFKLRSVELKRRGYGPPADDEALFVFDRDARDYCPLTDRSLARLGISPFESELDR